MRALAAAVLVLWSGAAGALDYQVQIEAPRELRQILEKGLNIVRWRTDPEVNEEMLRRLMDDAVRESREVAATEGYFSAQATIDLEQSSLPWQVRLHLDPGERTRVSEVEIRFTGPALADGEARPLLARVREKWSLRRGQPFRQADWDDAKSGAVRELAGWRYAAARLADSRADIDAQGRRAKLSVTLESGPRFRFGALSITGTKRYSDRVVANLAPLRPGDTYDRDKLLLYQRRLLESGYFASVQAEIDAQPALADAAPLRVAVLEAPKHHIETGIGYNTDVGPNLSARYSNQDVLSRAWRFRTTLDLDRKIQNLQFDVDTPPRPGGVWTNFFTRARNTDIENQVTREIAGGASLNYGATDTPYSLLVSAHNEDLRLPDGTADASYAVYFGARKSFRRTDSFISPREGYVLSGEIGGAPQRFSSRTFLRGVANASLFIPIARNDDFLLRGQAGAVFSDSREGIPSTFLFRTGGDQTVRGYAFESLGVAQGGATVGGRRLAVGSAEYTRWVGESWGVATFFDIGNAWDSGAAARLARGFGVGARFRTPIGPIRADVAYGQQTHEIRLHFSVGYGF